MIISQGLPRAKPKSPSVHAKVDFKFSMSPNEIQGRGDLTRADKDVFAVILSLSRASGGSCWLCNESICRTANVSIRNLKRTLPKLERLGLISRRMDGYRRAEIVVTWKPGAGLALPEREHSANAAPGECQSDAQGGVPARHMNGTDERSQIKLFAPLSEGEEPPVKFDWRRLAAELKAGSSPANPR